MSKSYFCKIWFTYIIINKKLSKRIWKKKIKCVYIRNELPYHYLYILTWTKMYLLWKHAPAKLRPTTTKMSTPITIRIMESALTVPTAESTVNESRRGLMFSVLMFDTSVKARGPTIINPNPINCKKLEKQIQSRNSN